MLFSGVVLYFSPRGRTAHWTDWKMLTLGKEQWTSLHINISLLFVAASIFHLILNWKAFWSYFRKKSVNGMNRKTELAIAAALTLVFTFGSARLIQPFKMVMDVNEQIKDAWESEGAGPPIPHGEELTCEAFAQQVGIDPAEFVAALEDEGYTVEDPAVTTIREAAASKGENVPPSQLFEDLKKHFPKLNEMKSSGAGYGKMTVRELANQLGISPPDVFDVLDAEGYVVERSPTTMLRDVAQENGLTAPELMEVLRKHYPEMDATEDAGSGGGAGMGSGMGSGGGGGSGRGTGAGSGL